MAGFDPSIEAKGSAPGGAGLAGGRGTSRPGLPRGFRSDGALENGLDPQGQERQNRLSVVVPWWAEIASPKYSIQSGSSVNHVGVAVSGVGASDNESTSRATNRTAIGDNVSMRALRLSRSFIRSCDARSAARTGL